MRSPKLIVQEERFKNCTWGEMER